jgi:hypothetical protein
VAYGESGRFGHPVDDHGGGSRCRRWSLRVGLQCHTYALLRPQSEAGLTVGVVGAADGGRADLRELDGDARLDAAEDAGPLLARWLLGLGIAAMLARPSTGHPAPWLLRGRPSHWSVPTRCLW